MYSSFHGVPLGLADVDVTFATKRYIWGLRMSPRPTYVPSNSTNENKLEYTDAVKLKADLEILGATSVSAGAGLRSLSTASIVTSTGMPTKPDMPGFALSPTVKPMGSPASRSPSVKIGTPSESVV